MAFRAIHFREKYYFNLVLQIHFACIKSRIEKIHIDVLFSNTLNVPSVIEINIYLYSELVLSKNLSSMTYLILSGLNSPLSSTISILDKTSIYLFVIFQCFQRFTIEDPLGRIMSFSIHHSNTAFLKSLQVVYFFPSK